MSPHNNLLHPTKSVGEKIKSFVFDNFKVACLIKKKSKTYFFIKKFLRFVIFFNVKQTERVREKKKFQIIAF